MKRYMSSSSRVRINPPRVNDMKKPFGFCCDFYHQDPETQYDMRNPPFESAFVNTRCVTSVPDVQFRVQDNAKVSAPIPRIAGVYREDVEIKKAATYGRSKKGRGPLTCFLEDEIEAARDILAEEKKMKWEMMHEKQTVKPAKTHRNSRRTNSVQDDENSTSAEIDNNEIN